MQYLSDLREKDFNEKKKKANICMLPTSFILLSKLFSHTVQMILGMPVQDIELVNINTD